MPAASNCLDLCFQLETKHNSLKGMVQKACKTSIQEAQQATKYGQPLLSQLLTAFQGKHTDYQKQPKNFMQHLGQNNRRKQGSCVSALDARETFGLLLISPYACPEKR